MFDTNKVVDIKKEAFMVTYINGVKASKADQEQLMKDLKAGIIKVKKAFITRKGNMSIRTEG